MVLKCPDELSLISPQAAERQKVELKKQTSMSEALQMCIEHIQVTKETFSKREAAN